MHQNPGTVLGATIRDMRTKLGLTQEQLAEKTNLHRTYIGGVEGGERNVGLLKMFLSLVLSEFLLASYLRGTTRWLPILVSRKTCGWIEQKA
jgi:transcriptional regulator with XRE-family HTH domain